MHNKGTVPTYEMHKVRTVPLYKTRNLGTKLSYATIGTTIKFNSIKSNLIIILGFPPIWKYMGEMKMPYSGRVSRFAGFFIK